MLTEYTYVIKKINEKNTICTISAAGVTAFDLEVPIVSNDYEPTFTTETNPEKAAIKADKRTEFRLAVRKYILDYFAGKDKEAAQVVSISPTILAIEGQSFVINVNE